MAFPARLASGFDLPCVASQNVTHNLKIAKYSNLSSGFCYTKSTQFNLGGIQQNATQTLGIAT